MLYMALCSFMMILALSEMFRTMTAIGNGSFAGNRFIPLALVLLTLALASPPPFCCASCMAIVPGKTAVSGIPVRPLPQW